MGKRIGALHIPHFKSLESTRMFEACYSLYEMYSCKIIPSPHARLPVYIPGFKTTGALHSHDGEGTPFTLEGSYGDSASSPTRGPNRVCGDGPRESMAASGGRYGGAHHCRPLRCRDLLLAPADLTGVCHARHARRRR